MNKIFFLRKLNHAFKTGLLFYFISIFFSSMSFAEPAFLKSDVFETGEFYNNKQFSKFLKDNYLNFFQDELKLIEDEVRKELPDASEEKIQAVTKEVVGEVNKQFNEKIKNLVENPAQEIREKLIAKNPKATEADVIKEIKKMEIVTRLHIELEEIKAGYLEKSGIKVKKVKNPYIRLLPRIQRKIKEAFNLPDIIEDEKEDAKSVKIPKDKSKSSTFESFMEGGGLKDFFLYNPLEKTQKGRGYSEWLDIDNKVKIRALSSQVAFKGNKPFLIGVQFLIQDHNDILPWRLVGDLKKQIYLGFDNSENIASWEVKRPAPKRYIENNKEIWGYKNMVIIPILITPQKQNEDIIIKNKIDFKLCHQDCVNLSGYIPSITISYGVHTPSTVEQSIQSFVREVTELEKEYLEIKDVSLEQSDKEEYFLLVKSSSDKPKSNNDVLVESESGIRFFKPSVMVRGNDIFFKSLLDSKTIPEKGILGEKIKIIVTSNIFWAEKEITINEISKKPFFYLDISFGLLFFAFFAGVIFNLYPPLIVFNIESLSLSKSFGALQKTYLKKQFIIRALGLALFFLLLGLLGNFLRKFNHDVVLGVWFNSTPFLLGAFLLSALWFLYRLGYLQFFKKNYLFMELIKGFLVSFLGVSFSLYIMQGSVNFAFLYANYWQSMLIFGFIALGVMTPHLVFLFRCWNDEKWSQGNFLLKNVPFADFIILLLVIWFMFFPALGKIASNFDSGFKEYNQKELEQLINQGQTVFFEANSDYCLKCKIVDFFVTNSGLTNKTFAQYNIAKMRANTSHDASLTASVLKRFGETKEPIYAFFNSDYPEGFMIKEIMGNDVIQKNISNLLVR